MALVVLKVLRFWLTPARWPQLALVKELYRSAFGVDWGSEEGKQPGVFSFSDVFFFNVFFLAFQMLLFFFLPGCSLVFDGFLGGFRLVLRFG